MYQNILNVENLWFLSVKIIFVPYKALFLGLNCKIYPWL